MTTPLRAAVVGASGYTGGELLRLLSLHPRVRLSRIVASDKSQGLALSSLLPNLAKIIGLELSVLNPEVIAKDVDVVFLSLPHTQSLQPVADFLSKGKLVIDLSADYRLKDPLTYEKWYGSAHTFPDILGQAVYGLPEFHRKEIATSRLVAVPGCYPTVAILQLAPFVAQGLLEPEAVIIDAKSGVSGAGRSPALGYHFPEAHEAIHAYKLTTHRHSPEIVQELTHLQPSSQIDGATTISLLFIPHLIPINRGILSTAYAKVRPGISRADILEVYRKAYQEEYFIRLHPAPDSVNPNNLRGSNFCDLGCTFDDQTRYLITTGALDNLVKGAAGQAIQCMNLMCGFPEHEGLTGPGVFP